MAEGGISGGRNLVVGRGLIEILPDFKRWGKQLAADMRIARTQMDGTAAGFRKSAGTIGASMAAAGKGASLVGLGVAVASVKMAGDFQAGTAVLQTAAGESAKGLKTVRAGILSISQNTGTGIKNLTDGMYLIEKAGFRGSAGLQVLRAAAQGAREENAKLSDVTNAMTSIMASYHLKADKSVMVMNAMKTAAGEGKINMEEFSGALSTVLPIASANKISFEQVAGAMATLTQHGTSAREATHELGATIRALASPNMVAQREMARFGLSSVDVSQNLGKRGLTGTIQLLTSTILSKMGPSGKILLSAFEGTKQSAEDAQIMLSKMPPEFQKISKQFLSGKIDADQWKATIKGAPVAIQPMLRNFNTLVNRSKGFSRELKSGGPAAKTYTDALKKMSGGAIGLNTILQLSGESFAGFKDRVGKVGASLHHNTKDVEGWKTTQKLLNVQLDMAKQRLQVLFINIGTKLIPVVVRIVKLFTDHKNITLVLVATILGLVTALSAAYVFAKLWSVVTGIATAAMFAWNVATMAETDSMAVMRGQLAVLWVMQKAQAAATAIATGAQWLWNAAMTANPIGLIIVGVAALIAIIVLIATKTHWFQNIWKATWGFIKKIFTGFTDWLKNNWQLILFSVLTLGIGLIVAEIVRHWDGVKHAFSVTLDWVKKYWPYILGVLLGPIALAVAAIWMNWKSITKAFTWVFNKIVDLAKSFGRTLADFFTKLPGQLGRFFSSLPGLIGHWFTVAGTSIASFFSKLPGQIARTATGFGKALVSVGGDLIKGLFHGAADFFTKTVPGWAKSVWKGITSFFKAVFGIHSPSTVMAAMGIDLIRGLFVGMLKAALVLTSWLYVHLGKPIINMFTKTIPDAARTFASRVSTAWNNTRDNLGKAWATVKRNAVDPIIKFFSVSIPAAGKTMRDAIIGFVRRMVLSVLDSFGAIIHGAVKLFGWVPGVGGKLKKAEQAFRTFRDNVNRALGGIKDRHPTVGVGMKIMTGKNAGLVNIGGIARAKGGPIDGPGTETSDDVLMWGSKNEHVWTAKEVKAVGGHQAMHKLRRLALLGLLDGYRSGGEIKGYADGGAVDVRARTPGAGGINSGTSHAFANLMRANVWALIKAFKASQAAAAGPSFIGLGGVGKSARSAMAYAQKLLGAHIYGWGMGQWPSWRSLGMGESGWRWNALNRSSGAYGIPQALPAGKMRSAGADWRTNAFTQVRWMASYIHSVYGSPANAWRRWLGRSPHWYDSGGVAKGVGAIFKRTNAPERILSPRQTAAFERLVDHAVGRGGGGGTTVVHANFHNHAIIGSQHEMENWLVTSFDQLQRKGRIRVITRTGS